MDTGVWGFLRVVILRHWSSSSFRGFSSFAWLPILTGTWNSYLGGLSFLTRRGDRELGFLLLVKRRFDFNLLSLSPPSRRSSLLLFLFSVFSLSCSFARPP